MQPAIACTRGKHLQRKHPPAWLPPATHAKAVLWRSISSWIYPILWWFLQNVIEVAWSVMKTKCHRTVLACVAGGCHTGGCFHWRCFPRVHAIAGCIGDGLGTSHLLITQHGHLWFLHVSGFYWTMCRVPVVPHVSFLWAHMSCCGWITCHFFIGPCGIFLLVHVAVSYSTTRHGTVRPRCTFLFGHVAWRHPSTCWIFNSPRVVLWLFHVSCTGFSMCLIFIWSRGMFWFYHVEYNQFVIEVIQDHHYCTD